MVSVPQMAVSNDLMPTHLPANLVAIFVGGTSGLGEAALKVFTKRAVSPRVYIVGRSQVRAQRIIGDCKVSNPDGEYNFLQADLSLMRNVDVVCEKIKAREEVVNLLFLSQGGTDNLIDRAGKSSITRTSHAHKTQRLNQEYILTLPQSLPRVSTPSSPPTFTAELFSL